MFLKIYNNEFRYDNFLNLARLSDESFVSVPFGHSQINFPSNAYLCFNLRLTFYLNFNDFKCFKLLEYLQFIITGHSICDECDFCSYHVCDLRDHLVEVHNFNLKMETQNFDNFAGTCPPPPLPPQNQTWDKQTNWTPFCRGW